MRRERKLLGRMGCAHPRRILCAAVLAVAALVSSNTRLSASPTPAAQEYFVYVGTYTHGASKGIYLYRFDERTGRLSSLGLAAEMANPSFVVASPNHRFLYALSEMPNGSAKDRRGDGPALGSISGFAINPRTGALTFLDRASSGGVGPAHLGMDKTGRILFVANYGSGSIASYAIFPDGRIGAMTGFNQHRGHSINPQRQSWPHAHEAVVSPGNRFLYTPDLGLDRIFIYRINLARRTFTPNNPAHAAVRPGLGPRHIAFAPNGKFAYVVCEMGSAVVAFAFHRQTGALTPIQTISTLPAGYSGFNGAAEIHIDKSGRFLYVSNRGVNNIVEFQIDESTGRLKPVQSISTQGEFPRNFVIDPTGRYLLAANQNSNTIVVFKIDAANGHLTPTGQSLPAGAPVCLQFVPEARVVTVFHGAR